MIGALPFWGSPGSVTTVEVSGRSVSVSVTAGRGGGDTMPIGLLGTAGSGCGVGDACCSAWSGLSDTAQGGGGQDATFDGELGVAIERFGGAVRLAVVSDGVSSAMRLDAHTVGGVKDTNTSNE